MFVFQVRIPTSKSRENVGFQEEFPLGNFSH
jgi:hypothetical protein